MRFAMILAGVGSLALAGCGDKTDADAVANADTGLTAEHISSNDVTAIDAVTGEAANMAADVEFDVNATDESDGNAAAPSNRTASGPSTTRPRPVPRPAPETSNDSTPAEEPASNAQ